MADTELLSQLSQSPPLDDRSRHLRRLVIRALEGGKRGHIGASMSLIEIMRVLYDDFLRYRAEEPDWIERDRCILSKGHGCLALYALLADKGFFPLETLDGFCTHTSILGGHPERSKVPGVEASTGALGHGLNIGLGMALGSRLHKRDNRVVVVLGDGEINEGSVWEAALAAGKHRVDNLTAFVDYNKLQSYGPTALVQDLEPLVDKWRAFGFAVAQVDGHNYDDLRQVVSRLPLEPGCPSAVICHTVKGKGIPFAEHRPEWHHQSRMAPELINDLYRALERESEQE